MIAAILEDVDAALSPGHRSQFIEDAHRAEFTVATTALSGSPKVQDSGHITKRAVLAS
jgi:hypothetical protein